MKIAEFLNHFQGVKKTGNGWLARCPAHDDKQASLSISIGEMELYGPVRGNWPNYSRLSERRHHCHIKKGKPTYVAIWEVTNKGIRLIEVTYAGTHEKAPY